MKKIYRIIPVTLLLFALACADDSLDPLRFSELQKASMLALRGDGDANANFFFKNLIFGDEKFIVEAEFLSDNQDLLSEVQVYARNLKTNTRSTLLTTIPGSEFTIPSGGKYRYGTITVNLSAVLNGLNITAAEATSLDEGDIQVETDLSLSDGTTVRSESFINAGLFASVVFYPAHKLAYRATDVNDFKPVATTSIAGEVVKNAAGKVTSRPVFPLKAGAKDTLKIKYDQKLITAPIVTYSPANAIIAGPVVTSATNPMKDFYQIVEATAAYTGAVTATVSNGVADTFGVDLTQNDKKQTLNVDNTLPQVISSSTGDRIGKGQFVTLEVNFNEKMSAKAATALKVSISGQNMEPVTNAAMTLSSNGTTASLIYIFKEANTAVPATHGPLTLVFTGGADEAGNLLPNGAINGSLICDVGTPPAPALTTAVGYDLGTQIKWTVDQTTGIGNPGGSIGGTVYFVAITSGDAAPLQVDIDQDGVATWAMAVDATPPVGSASGTKVVNRQAGQVTVKGGSSGVVFTPFAANGIFDIYAVFLSSSGTQSIISTAPAVLAPVSGNPITVTMN